MTTITHYPFRVTYRTPTGREKVLRVLAPTKTMAVDLAVGETGCNFSDILTIEESEAGHDPQAKALDLDRSGLPRGLDRRGPSGAGRGLVVL